MSKKIDPKKLPEGIAQAAYNVQFGQGHISPIKNIPTLKPRYQHGFKFSKQHQQDI